MAIYETYRDCRRIFYLEIHKSTLSSISINDTVQNMSEVKYEISYSLDNLSWLEWVDFANVQVLIDELNSHINEIDVYLRVQIEVVKNQKLQTHSFYALNEILVDSTPSSITNISIIENSDIIINTRSKNLFNPYRVSDQQKQLYGKLSRSISDIFSFECTYFRVQPDTTAQDVTFKTYTLNNVIDSKTLPIVIRNNDLPHDKLLFTDFDIDFQDELEVHIVKEVFYEIFGENQEPNARDFMFLPLTGRMYEVNVTANGDLFFNSSPFWKTFLVKYENRASVKQSEDSFDSLEELIDYSHEYEEEQYSEEKDDAVNSYNDVSVDSSDNISKYELNINDIEVFKFSFNYENIINSEIAKSYTFNATQNEIGIALWVELKEFGSLLQLHDSEDNVVYDIKSGSSFSSTIHSQTQQDLTIYTEELIADEHLLNSWIGIVANYVYTDDVQRMTLSIYNTKLELIHEIAEMNILEIHQPVKLSIFGGLSYANLRVSKQFINKDVAKQILSTMITSTGDYYVIDNATPKIITK